MTKNKGNSAVLDEPILDEVLKLSEPEKLPIEEMPLNSIRDYRLYNEEARKMNKKLKICRYPIKPCPVELHPTERVIFRRNDQPTNPLPVFLSDDKIHFEKKLIPGHTYDLPSYIVNYLAEKGDPVWERYTNPDGSCDSRVVTKKPRFSLTRVYQEQ